MNVYLFLKDKLMNFCLPQEISGSFSFDEDVNEESKLINIEARDNKWYLYSTDDVFVLFNNTKVKELEVLNNNFYIIRRNNLNYLIYICNLIDSNLSAYSYDKLNLLIGNSSDCNIQYKCNFFKGCIAKIYFENNNIMLNVNNGYIYVNNCALSSNPQKINYGDKISIFSLKIIILQNIILINNPNNDDNLILSSSGLVIKEFNLDQNDNLEIKDRDLYIKEEYFSKSPRIRRRIETKEIKMSPPPDTRPPEELPFILTIGPMLTMGLLSLTMLGSSLSNIFMRKSSVLQQLPSLITSSAMLISMLLWPTLIRRYNKRRQEKKRKEIIEKYTKYLKEKEEELFLESKLQKEILFENLLTPNDCLNIIEKKGYSFWDKRVDQDDFLNIRIGVGNELLDVKISFPESDFVIEVDKLKKQAEDLIEKYKYIKDVPIGYSFLENNITAIMGNKKKVYPFINNIVLQMLAFYSYEDIKFVIFTDEDKINNWEYMKYLNHTLSNNRRFRFFSSNIDDNKYLSDYLINEVNSRKNSKEKYLKPHYIIITDNYDRIKKYDFLNEIVESEDKLGFSIIILENSLSKLPSKCSNFISLGNDSQGGILKNSYEKQEQVYFKDEIIDSIDMMKVAKILSNIPIEFESNMNNLPDSISFIEMEKVGKVEQLNILNRWNINDSTSSLKAEIGVDEEGDLMYLDLHEKAHGPHGLIAGTTGSGKSEFIITYILSMCINYSPDDISFILIDYKGGGLALAFENKVANIVLPHLAGTITNLDKAEMDRTLVSIDSEVKRRQVMFNEAREQLGESTIDIYKYQRFYHDGRLTEAIPHLFIICDEFAELKTQQPEFMDNLISVARIGRSLGVHLILATQKPSGVVNAQIWSNSRFKVCLKVQDESDSKEMLKKNDAAYIKQAGRYYLQVGYDEYYALGQSGFTGAKYYPSDKIFKQVDKSLNIINDCGLFLKSIQASSGKKVDAKGDQLSAVLNEIINTANRVNKYSRKLWLDNIPSIILIDDLFNKYNVTIDNNNIEAIIGEYDAPERQEQGLIKYNFLHDGNTLIYGNDGVENELLLSAIIYSTTKYYSSLDINFYVIDYGSESFQRFVNMPHFGGVVVNGEEEEFNNLLKMIKEEIKQRKKIMADFGGEYLNYLKSSKSHLPIMVIMFNNYDSIYETHQFLYDDLPELVRDSERYGIIFIMTGSATNSIHRRVALNFSNVYAFKLKDYYDYSNVLSCNTKMTPRKIEGRGLLNNDGVHEFQVARILENNDEMNDFIDSFIKEKILVEKNMAKRVPVLPDIVRFNDVNCDNINLNNIPIGISKKDLQIINYDFLNNIGNLIISNKLVNMEKFAKSLMIEIINSKNISLFIFDPMKLLNIDSNYFSNYYIDNFDEIVSNLIDNIKKLIENKQNVYGTIIVYGFSKFVNSVKNEYLVDLSDCLKKYEKISLIIMDEVSKIKSYSFESWFKIFSTNDGIWVGSGIYNQNIFRLGTLNKEMREDIKNDMGFYISENNATLCRLIDFISKDDDNG